MALHNAKTEQTGKRIHDYRLLLNSLENANFDQAGSEFVRKALNAGIFWQDFSDEEILRLSAIAQQHGLLDQSLNIFSWLNQQRPDCEEGWLAHLELLQLLNRESESVTLLSRLPRHVPANRLAELKKQVIEAAEKNANAKEDATIIEPFLQLRREDEDIALFLRLFRGREEAFARQWADRQEEKQGYVPVQRHLLAEDIREHLQGKKTYGIYLLTNDNKVWTGVIDVDLAARLRNANEAKKENGAIKREAVYLYKRIKELSAQAGLTCVCEISGGKGYHFWFPASAPVPAGIMKNALQVIIRNLAADVKCFNLEVFPKQESLSGKGYGNLVKLPLGIHRGSGKKSRFIPTGGSDKQEQQFALLRTCQPTPPENFLKLVEASAGATIHVHPKHAEWAEKYPELAILSTRCAPLGQIMAVTRAGRGLSLREEKILLGVLSHLPRGRLLLHHLCSNLPEYNRPLLDYKISRIRGTVLGCKRIHSLLDDHSADLPCTFPHAGYHHPLLHIPDYHDDADGPLPIAERVTNLQDALLCLKTAIEQIQRFL